ncbi:FAD-dependent oxidoreductase [Exiguobacterium sp. SL14]|nr:FAD-dependent oxidoreductase [Exiguobacterium sp. SL14]MCY1689948.1 FAD-dependent oxidoreductase [Exiguobacterium sp. SL14]
MSYLTGFPSSYWKKSTPAITYPALNQDAHHDVVVVGAGIAGLVTAMQLTERGYDVVVIEAGDVL